MTATAETFVATDNLAATPAQTFALFSASKRLYGKGTDYRNQNLTRAQAKTELTRLNNLSGYQGKNVVATATNNVPTAKIVTRAKIVTKVKNVSKTNNVLATNIVEIENNVKLEDSARAYIVSNIHLLVESLAAELGIESVVMNDTKLLPDDGKRFKMYGQGCGFATIDGYRKTEKNIKLVKLVQGLKEYIDSQVRGYFSTKDLLSKPFLPLQAQSLAYNITFEELACKWLLSQGVSNCNVKSWLD